MSKESIKEDFEIYLSCNPERVKECRTTLMLYSPASLMEVIYLPKDSEERFRVYDLLFELGKPGEKLLEKIYDECKNKEDPLSQLAAIEFIHEHKMYSPDLFISLFNEYSNDPILFPTIAATTIPMLLKEPEKHVEMLKTVIDQAVDDHNLLGVLPDIARTKFGAKLLIESPKFMEFIEQIQTNPDLRTMNFYIRTLMVPNLDDPKIIFLPLKEITRALNNPHIGLRVAVLEHIAATAKYCINEFLQDHNLMSALCDTSSDSTIDEEKSRLKAQDALGISIQVSGKPGVTQIKKVAEPEVMVI